MVGDKIIYTKKKGEGIYMNNSRFKNGALFGSIIGASLGIIFGTRMGPMKRRRLMRTARRASSTLKNGINSLWE